MIPQQDQEDEDNENETIVKIINKYNEVWKKKTCKTIRDYHIRVSRSDYGYLDPIPIIHEISGMLKNTLSLPNDDTFMDKMSHICGCIAVIVKFCKDIYLKQADNSYQYEICAWKQLIESKISFSDKLLCVKVMHQLFNTKLLCNYVVEKYETCIGDTEYNFCLESHIVLLHFVEASNVDEFVRKYKLWNRLNYTNETDQAIFPFFPRKHGLEDDDVWMNKIWNWELWNLCIDNKDNLCFFQEFIEKANIFKQLKLEDYRYLDEPYWFNIVHQAFNSLCTALFEKHVSPQWINIQYVKYIDFVHDNFDDKLENLDNVTINPFIQSLCIGIPSFIDVEKIDYLRNILLRYQINSCLPSKALIDKVRSNYSYIRPDSLIETCKYVHDEMITNMVNYALKINEIEFVSDIIDCIFETVDEKNIIFFVIHLFGASDIKNYLQIFCENIKKLCQRLHCNGIFDIHSNSTTKYLNVMMVFIDTFGTEFINKNNILDQKSLNTLKCILLYNCSVCNKVTEYLKYLEMSQLLKKELSISAEILLESLKCIRNKEIIFIQKNGSDDTVVQYEKNKSECYDYLIDLILQTQTIDVDGNDEQRICEFIEMCGLHSTEFFFNTQSAIYLISGIMNKYKTENKIRDCLQIATKNILKKCFNFWGDRLLKLSTKKELQIECDKLQQLCQMN
eukprot:94970_1